MCDSGFRLPGEAQKIDRMLEAFCQAYCRDNPSVFRNSGSAFVVCFALVMLNTDVHDPRLKTGNSSRKPMSLDQFVSNLRGVDDGNDFPRAFLQDLYNNICANAIEWKDNRAADAAGTAAAAAKAAASGTEADVKAAKAAEEKATRKMLELMARKSQAYLKTNAPVPQDLLTPSNADIVSGMWETCWFSFVAAITARVESTTVSQSLSCAVLAQFCR